MCHNAQRVAHNTKTTAALLPALVTEEHRNAHEEKEQACRKALFTYSDE